MKNKGQLHIQETIFVVFILIVIILLGLVVFYRFTASGLESEAEQNEMLRFKALIATTPEIGEIKCSKYGQEDNCIDAYKMILMGALTESDANYKRYMRDKYGFMEITIGMVYPTQRSTACKVSNTKECGVWTIYSHEPSDYRGLRRISTPVSVYTPWDDQYGIAIMNITRFMIE
jgi:hypothetical protein